VELARRELCVPEVERKLVPLSTLVESETLDGCGCVPTEGTCGSTTTTPVGLPVHVEFD
jgi:phosphoglycerate kinase